MNIVCPNCNFSKTVDPAKVPDRPVKVNCPKCSQSFTFDKALLPVSMTGVKTENSPVGQVNSPKVEQINYQPPQLQPKAGFWIRVVASLLDSFLLGVVQFVLSLSIGLVIGMLGIATADDPSINIVIGLFGVSLSIGYAVFFTGYCGQTPGKMALRIKVIRTDGSPMTYGRAVLREVLGKFISGILLCIGYIMVAFDSQKQGLHDKIADTYVIKL